MKNRPDLQLTASDHQAQQLSCEERLEDYMEHLSAPLIGIMPYPERKAFRQEAQAHIDGLIREYMWQGKDLHAATETALREFGEPWKVGHAFLEEWLRGHVRQCPALLIRTATWTAFAWFGLASMLTLLLLERDVLVSGHEVLLPGTEMLAFLAPFVAGGLVGAMSPAQAERGVRNAVLLAMHAIATGWILQPRVEGFVFAGWQLLFWLPMGWVSAAVTANRIRQVRRQRFWQRAR